MYINKNTIAAISTPIGQGGICGIRISGENAFNISKKVFKPINNKNISKMAGYTAAYGDLIDIENNNKSYDKGVLLVYKSPRSYTGEDVVEIFCHGGVFVAEKTLMLLLQAGATPAAAGEFTKRAFLNGKISLTQAESVMDIITANTDSALQMASSGNKGKLSKEIDMVTQKLIDLSAFFGAWFDYPEEGEEEQDEKSIVQTLKDTLNIFSNLIKTYHQGKLIKEGIPTVIIGKPNVGKSTLMNLLLKEERSIVTNIPGTTRDVIEETLRLDNIVLRLSDTAGIRDTDDEVEKIGVEITYKKINEANLILALFDATENINEKEMDLIKSIKNKNVLAIVNKIDMEKNANFNKKILEENFKHIIYISAKTKEGLENFEKSILEILALTNFDPMATVLSNKRQYNHILRAQEYILEAHNALLEGFTWDMVSISVESAISELLELTGKQAGEEIVNNIFEQFCVGK